MKKYYISINKVTCNFKLNAIYIQIYKNLGFENVELKKKKKDIFFEDETDLNSFVKNGYEEVTCS